MAKRDELAGTTIGVAGPGGPPGGDPVTVLACRVGDSLVEAGFSLHHCDQGDPLYRLGGVCLTPVPVARDGDPAGVCVSWTTHDELLFGEDRWATRSVVVRVMNTALGTVLRTLGHAAEPFGTGGAWIVPLTGGHGAEGAPHDSGH